MPRTVAASTAMLLTPTPCLEITFRLAQRSIACALSSTVRKITASTGSLAITASTSAVSDGSFM